MYRKKNWNHLILSALLAVTMALSGCGGREAEVSATVPSSQAEESVPATLGTVGAGSSQGITVPLPGAGGEESGTAPESSGETEETPAGETGGGEGTSAADPGTSDVKAIALTFDDGPDTGNTKATTKILDTLEKYDAKATFFVVGQALKEWFPDTGKAALQRAVSMGCEIGTHTYSHKNLNKQSSDVIAEEISKGCEVIEEATGQEVTLLRPPYGNAKQEVLDQVDMPMIQWDVDTLDWDCKDADTVVNNILKDVKPGSIILMHDTYSSTAEAVEQVVPKLLDQGYQLVTVSELFELYGKQLEPHHQYFDARSN